LKSRDLEEFLATESGVFGEVTARLQRLREARLLPDTRGLVEPRLRADEVASSILSNHMAALNLPLERRRALRRRL
jgi:hypothetical protein